MVTCIQFFLFFLGHYKFQNGDFSVIFYLTNLTKAFKTLISCNMFVTHVITDYHVEWTSSDVIEIRNY